MRRREQRGTTGRRRAGLCASAKDETLCGARSLSVKDGDESTRETATTAEGGEDVEGGGKYDLYETLAVDFIYRRVACHVASATSTFAVFLPTLVLSRSFFHFPCK